MTRSLFDTLKRDCRAFRSDRPCAPHKSRGVTCETCDVYEPIRTRIAIVKLAAVGDVLRTTSFLSRLHEAWPSSSVSWLTLPAAAPMFDGNPHVDAVFTTDGSVLPAALALTPFDVVICPDADAATAALATRLRLRPGGRRLGFAVDEDGCVTPLSDAARRWFELGISDELKKANTETYQNLVGAVFDLPGPIVDRPIWVVSEHERERARTWFASATSGERPVVGLNTGAGARWPLKQWTLAGQLALIASLHGQGCATVLLGGPDERGRHRDLLAQSPVGSCIDGGNDNALRDFAARVDLCDVIVTGDTMALHIAAALRKPIVALFGPTSAAEIELYGRGEKVFTSELDCLCCYSNCDKQPNCQDLISADMVLAAVVSCLRGDSRGSGRSRASEPR